MTDVLEGWNIPERSAHDLAELRELLSQYTTNTEDMSEIIVESQRPVIIQRTETNDMVIELSAGVKRGMLGGVSYGRESRSQSPTERLRSFFESVETPAVTTEEVVDAVDYPKSEVIHHLIELDHRGWIDHRQSGETTLWWPQDDNTSSNLRDDFDHLPEYVNEGIKKSNEDIKNWVESNKREDESFEETYERMRGAPTVENARIMIEAGDSSMKSALENLHKNTSSKKSKDNLKNIFK